MEGTLGVVVLHDDRVVLEQVVETLESCADLFVAATSPGARADVIVAGGSALFPRDRLPAPVVALAGADQLAAARAALAVGARDLVCWPAERTRLASAVRAAVRSADPAGSAGRVIAVTAARGGLGTSTLAVALAVHLPDTVVIDLDGGQRTFCPGEPAPTTIPDGARAETLRAAAVSHAGSTVLVTPSADSEDHALRAARGLPWAVVDAGRRAVPDATDRVVLTGNDVGSLRAARGILADGAGAIVVLRRSRFGVGTRDVEAALERPVDVVIGDDAAAARAGDLGKLPSKRSPTIRAAIALAARLRAPAS